MLFNRLDRYILQTAMTPAIISLLIAGLLLILEQMLRLLDFVLNENGPVDVVWRMLAYLVPHYLGLALPISIFMGVVLAVRKVALSSERDAMLAVGLSPWRLMRPLWLLTLVGMGANFMLLAYVQPYAQYEFHQLRYELQAGLLGARVPVGKFVTLSEDIRIRIGRTANSGTDLHDLFLIRKDQKNGTRTTFSADRGRFVRAGEANSLILKLYEGRMMLINDEERQPGVLNFTQQDITIELPDVEAFRQRGEEKREVTIDELARVLSEETAQSEPEWHAYRASYHFRLIQTLTFLGLPFLGGALGVVNRRRPSQAGPIVGLAMIIVYHELLEEWGEHQVELGVMSPFVSMWPLWVIFMGLSFLLFYRSSEQPGQRTLWIIDTGFPMLRDALIGVVRSLVGRKSA